MFGLMMALTIMACSELGETETPIVDSDEEVLAVQAISSAMLLSYNDSSVSQMANPMMQMGMDEEEVNDIDYYVELIETFLGNDQLNVETQTSDNDDYDYMIVYTTLNLDQETLTYTLYYNVEVIEEELTTEEEVTTEEPATTEEDVTTEEPTTEAPTTEAPTTEVPTTEAPTTQTTETQNLAFGDQDMDRPYRFEDEDDEFVTQYIEGILVFGDLTYDVEGKILMVEGKQITRIRSYIDDENFVLVNYQNDDREVDKEKFFFQVVEEGQVVSRSRMMFFQNDRIQHAQLEIIEGDAYARYQFHIREQEGVSYIHINYRIEMNDEVDQGHVRLIKTVDDETGEVVYEYNINPDKGQGASYRKNHGRPENPGNSQSGGRNPRSTM